MQVHQRGLDLMMNVQDAIDYVDILSKEDTLRLLREVNIVLSQLMGGMYRRLAYPMGSQKFMPGENSKKAHQPFGQRA